ncbi:MAG: hypothetical protein JSU72_11080 [Deltaproteobacteria bacterium]|nr:MAG: hypothetical protein JSU72_11080 [Deltaproteobacteria bacterium]
MTEDIMNKARSLASDYKGVFGDDLVSVILYGSAASAEYVPGKSDLNFLIVLSEDGIGRLNLAHALVAKWRKKKVSTPLFLTEAYIESSLDTFPIEFLNMQRNSVPILGDDVLKGLAFQKQFIRMQCERELKGKLLLLRERYVETGGKARILKQLLSASLPTFIFVFKALLYLLDKEVPATKEETVTMLAKGLELDAGLFQTLLRIRAGTFNPSASEMDELFKKYISAIRTLALLIDRKDFAGSPDPA